MSPDLLGDHVLFTLTVTRSGLITLDGAPMKGPLEVEFPKVLRTIADSIENGSAKLESRP